MPYKIKNELNNIETINEISQNLENYNKKFENNDKQLEDSLKNELKDCEKSIKNLMTAIENGIFTTGTKDRLLELESKKDDLKNRLAFIELCKKSMTADKIAYWLCTQLTKCETTEDKQQIIDIFVNRVIVYPKEIIIILNYSDETKNNQLKIDDLSDILDKIKDTSEQECSTVSALVTRRRIELLIQP